MKFDLILWGATSFVGQLVAKQLVEKYGEKLKGRLAFAGRNKEKLHALKTRLKYNAELLVGDSSDQAFLDNMVAQGKVIISTVGPYALYGEKLVKACAEKGKDYLDLTGEPQWIRSMIEKYEVTANESGARIIHCCGFDSVPSDMGVYLLQEKCKKVYGEPCTKIQYQFRKSKGGISGGTYASLLNAVESIRENPQEAKKFKSPYALMLNRPEGLPYQPKVKFVGKNQHGVGFLAPFIMASINTKIVHRTQFLLDYPWGKSFQYDEVMYMGKGAKGFFKAFSTALGLTAFMLAAAFKPTRNILQKHLLAQPGEGPTKKIIDEGFFNVRLMGQLDSGQHAELTVYGKGDPGYGSTSKMLSVLAKLLLEMPKSETGTGFLTPAVAFKSKGLDRLEEHAEMQFRFKVDDV